MAFAWAPNVAAAAPEARLTWYGHAAFRLESPGGTVALMDPVPDSLGYAMPQVKADVVTVSHEHFDHIALSKALGGPRIFRGRRPQGPDAEGLDVRVGDIRIRAVPAWHDDDQGRQRGATTIYVLETAGLTVVHLGDLGSRLTADQIQAIGPVDVLLVPVGGHFTVDAEMATKVVKQLAPKRWIVPMHFKTGRLKMPLPLATADAFLKGHAKARRVASDHLDLGSAPKRPQVILLGAPPPAKAR